MCKQSTWAWVWVCVIINQLSSRQLLVCLCNGSAPGSPDARPRCVCAFVHSYVRSRVGMGVCMCVSGIITLPSYVKSRVSMGVCICVCPASSLYRRQLLVCVCMCMCANIAECLQLHKAVILLLIMKYFALKIVSYSHTTTLCNLLSSPLKKIIHRTRSLFASPTQKADAWYKCYNFTV